MSLSDASVITSPLVSPTPASRRRPEVGPPLTLAEMEERVREDENLSPKRRQELVSAMHTLARALRREMPEIPAHPGFIGENLKGFSPAVIGVSTERWWNILSLVRSALKHFGLGKVRGKYREPMAPEWSELLALWDSKKRYGLYGVARFCTREGIAPSKVDDGVLARYRQHLVRQHPESMAIGKSARDLHRQACVTWNKAVESVPNWPQRKLTVPNYYDRYTLRRDAFLPSFIADLEAYLSHLRSGGDELGEDSDNFKPLREISVRTREREVLEFASALAHRDHDPATLTALKDLIPMNVVKSGLRFLLDRTPGKTGQAARMLYVVRCIAKHWAKAPAAEVKSLSDLLKKIQPKAGGLTKKNREMLRQLDDPEGLAAFVNLPETLMKALEKTKKTYRKALLVQTAVAFEILELMPGRLKNLGEIEIGKHLLPVGDTYRLAFESEEVKNENLLDSGGLPDKTAALIRLYITEHRPVLMKGRPPSAHLFPGTKNAGKNQTALGKQISDAAKKYAGLKITPHQFRHAAGKLYLDRNPGDYGTVQRFLGHKDIGTTTKIYTGAEDKAAFQNLYRNILELRDENPRPPKRRRTRKSRAPLR